jgi:cytochrome b561
MLNQYNRVQTTIHWIVAALIIFLLFTGTFILSEIPNSNPQKINNLTIHAVLGGLALVLVIVRVLVALKTPQPPHVKTHNAMMDRLGAMAPKVLNLLSLVVAVSGLVMGVGSGLLELIFTGVGALPETFEGQPVRIVHGLSSKLLIASVLLHVAAAFYHQFVLRDGIFRRISLFR